MKIINDPKELFEYCNLQRSNKKAIGFVPTMGALHEGHLTLVDNAKAVSDLVVTSIFVNPTQFGPDEDYDQYPRELKADALKLENRGVDIIFCPDTKTMYPKGACTTVLVKDISDELCGNHRPGHFAAVATIVSKLFNIVGSCTAVLGRKDYQQLMVIKQMVQDLNMPIKIVGVSTIREPDGLAMSSRNVYLSKEDRVRALSIPRGLSAAYYLFKSGQYSVQLLKQKVKEFVLPKMDSIDYITVANPQTLKALEYNDNYSKKILIAIAANVTTTRLIDNIVLGEDQSPIK